MKREYKIPEISDETLKALSLIIRPVVEVGDELYWIDIPDLRNTAFTWDVNITTKAVGLVPICRIETLHSWSYYGMFKPSIAEVIAQIPEELWGSCAAFLVEGPRDAADLNRESEALEACVHVAKTTLFQRLQ